MARRQVDEDGNVRRPNPNAGLCPVCDSDADRDEDGKCENCKLIEEEGGDDEQGE